jgi:hypothetical protein
MAVVLFMTAAGTMMRIMSQAYTLLHKGDVKEVLAKLPPGQTLPHSKLKKMCRSSIPAPDQLVARLEVAWRLVRDMTDAAGNPLFPDKEAADAVFQAQVQLAREGALSGGCSLHVRQNHF